MTNEWLFWDFDGVVCDSIEECFQSSGLLLTGQDANLGLLKTSAPPKIDFGSAYLERFRAGRPYIRSGEDYVVLHALLKKNQDPRSQADFDVALQAEAANLAAYKERLYALREALLAWQAPLWLSWNPLYPGMADALRQTLGDPRVLILSTKKASFIAAVLRFHGVDWPVDKILYTDGQAKMSIVDKVAGEGVSMLIDDQIDHLNFRHPRCQCRLALWGYASNEAKASGVPSLSLEQALALSAQR